MKRRVFLLATVALVGVVAFAVRDLASPSRSHDFETVQAMLALHATQVHVEAAEPHGLLARAPGDRRVGHVSPVRPPRRLSSIPSDPLVQNVDPKTKLPYEWQFASAHLGGALELTVGDPRIQVGVVDTGVDAVPDLAGKIDGLYDVTAHGTQRSASAVGNDDYGHGTAVASLIAAGDGDGFGMAGFGGAAHVIGIHADHQGRFYDTDIARAITKLDALGVRIVNLSIGGPYPSSPILVDAIDKAASDGMLIVAASGNEGGPVDWPAALLQQSEGGESYGLAVGATNAGGNHASFSNFGEHLSLVAPGILTGHCSGVLVALPRRNQLSDTCYPQWTGSGGTEVRLRRRHVPRVARGCRRRRARLGRPARAEELPGRRHRQGVRRPRCRRRLDADAGVRPPRRRGRCRARAQPHRCRVGVGFAVGIGLLLRRRRRASRPASHPDDHVQPHSGPNNGRRRLQPERTRVVGPAGHLHRPRRVAPCVAALST